MGAARDLRLRGWVRNINGTAVEILATGDEEAMAILVEACHQGPRLAQVDHVDVQPAADTDWTGFTKRFGSCACGESDAPPRGSPDSARQPLVRQPRRAVGRVAHAAARA